VTPEKWKEIEELYFEVAELEPADREIRLASVADPDLVREVRSLFGADSGNTRIASAVASVANLAAGGPPVPQRFGPWRVTGVAGHGGMGAVYQAVRDDQAFDRQVAIKVLHLGLDNPHSRERFRQERSILAGLDHPNIARLLDGGETEAGLSYIVMEYVDGEPIVDYCVRRKLPRAARLQLFLQLCSAIHLAHQNLIVHRDLKPANILVTPDGVPKLLDFGIAKLMEPSAMRTMTGFLALTPQYASPEQIRGEPVSTATDVYSLGMVLYEMLAERRPYEVDAAAMTEIARTVCQVQPAPPRIDPDLDNILMMALRKEPARRYPSVQTFAEDVERALANRPVRARPASFGYRASKFVRRNWLPLAAAAVMLASVGGGVFSSLRQARIARGRFDQVRELARSFVFDYYDDLARIEGTTATREKMVRTALKYLDNLAANAGADVELQIELAGAYHKVGQAQGYPTRPSLGKTADAIASYRKALEIHERIAARDPRHRSRSVDFYAEFASMLRYAHEIVEAARVAKLALEAAEGAARERPAEQAAQLAVSRCWCLLGDLDEDLRRAATALEKNRKCEMTAAPTLAQWRNRESFEAMYQARSRVGTSSRANGLFAEALRAFDDSEAMLNELLRLEPANPAYRRREAILANFRASVYFDDELPSLDDPARALPYVRRYLELAKQMFAKDPNSASARLSLAIAHYRLSFVLRRIDPPAAVEAARESVRLFDRDIAEGRGGYLLLSRRQRAVRRLAEALLAAGKPREARPLAEEALAVQRKTVARDTTDLAEAKQLALTLLAAAAVTDAVGDRAAGAALREEAERTNARVSRDAQ
jgi:tetratricopeptide (TPR) repeat protein